MTARMIRFDEKYAHLIDELEKCGCIEIAKDEKLELDPYFYERKASLDKTLKAVEEGSMKLYSEEEWEVEMKNLDIKLESMYGNQKD
ncbi:MAG: hypothetical protein WHU93_05505 [Arcobacteraceae bacterium]